MEKHIYIFKSETGECKIGVSNNVDRRRKAIEMMGGKRIVDIYHTPKCFNAYEIESNMHRLYADKRLVGEWFDIDYDNAIINLKKEFQENANLEFKDNVFDYISYTPKLDNNFYFFFDFSMNTQLNTYEAIVLSILRSLYSNKYADDFLLTIDTISYYLTGRFLNKSEKSFRTIANHILEAISSLSDKNIIEIIASNNGRYILSSKGLKLNDIDLDNTIEVSKIDVQKIFSVGNKPFEILEFYVNIISEMKNNKCHLSQDDMVCKWKYGKTTVVSYIKQLEEMKLLYVYRPNKRNENGTYKNINNQYSRYCDKIDVFGEVVE